jgi:hypothetical protein
MCPVESVLTILTDPFPYALPSVDGLLDPELIRDAR